MRDLYREYRLAHLASEIESCRREGTLASLARMGQLVRTRYAILYGITL